jgi:hypothetical protein
MEPIDWAWAIYCSVEGDIFGHAYMGMAILLFIKVSDFSNLPTSRLVVYMGCALLHILEFGCRPPPRCPDLFPVLTVLLSTPVFVFTWLWSIKSIIEARWTAGGLSVGG